MAGKAFVRRNFLAVLAFGVMVLSAFVAISLVETPTKTVTKASSSASGY